MRENKIVITISRTLRLKVSDKQKAKVNTETTKSICLIIRRYKGEVCQVKSFERVRQQLMETLMSVICPRELIHERKTAKDVSLCDVDTQN